MGEAARFRYRTLVAVGMRKQRLKRVFKAEPGFISMKLLIINLFEPGSEQKVRVFKQENLTLPSIPIETRSDR